MCGFVTYSMQGTEPAERMILLWFNKLSVRRNGANDSFKWLLLMLSYLLLFHCSKKCCSIKSTQCSRGHCDSLVSYLKRMDLAADKNAAHKSCATVLKEIPMCGRFLWKAVWLPFCSINGPIWARCVLQCVTDPGVSHLPEKFSQKNSAYARTKYWTGVYVEDFILSMLTISRSM